MADMRKRILSIVVFICMSLGILTGCTVGEKKIVFDVHGIGKDVLFSINDETCSLEEGRVYLCNFKNLYGRAYGIDLWEHEFDDIESNLEDYVKGITLNELTQIYCMNMVARQQELSLNEMEKKRVRVTAEAYYASLSDKEIEFMGITKDELTEIYKRYAIARKVYDSLTEGIGTEVSDDDARVIHLQKIFVPSDSMAKKISKRIKAGEDFSSIANEFGESGEYDIYVARGELPPEVEEIAFELDNNEISSCVKEADGYYFVRCISKFEEELTEANKEKILVQREKELFDNVYHEFVEQAEFRLNDKIWEQIDLTEMSEIQTDSLFTCFEQNF